MSDTMNGVIEQFRNLKVLVLGDAMLDAYLSGSSDRLCREAPVPVVSIQERDNVPGGAANTAVNVSSLGAEAIFLSVIGSDREGELLSQALGKRGVSTRHLLKDPGRATLAKQRVMAGAQMLVRFDQGSTEEIGEGIERAFIERLQSLYDHVDVVIVSDYNYGALTPQVIQALRRLQEETPLPLVIDSKRLWAFQGLKITAVKPNYDEAVELLGLPRISGEKRGRGPSRITQMESEGERVLAISGAEMAVVTIDRDGALLFKKGELPYRTYARPRPNSRAAGAGDTFVSALALALAARASGETAVELASAAAEVVVSKDGTAACYAEELRARFETHEKYVPDAFQLIARVAAYKREDRRIVFTNGCFDLLHSGHINYLNRAKALGDVLIVGLNSDDSVRRLKGATRPINELEERAQVLAGLSCVDYIVAFDEDTPVELIKIVRPDVFVKGGDYTRANLPEADVVEKLGGTVQILPYLENHSTTSIIERIRASLDDGQKIEK